ncbi:hypothetical protein [Bacillus cereus]|uniref:hypothetical protein n=1 Tax=Bacillus cereus TaxID=1396 RepID=UPI001C8BBD2B|nr:hypothetical protein [Bacillus cereus]MBX9158755.1 hypothetical protein [Bacillus cereus]
MKGVTVEGTKTTVKVNDEYTITIDFPKGVFHATRHGEPWRDLTGDQLVLSLCNRIEDLEEQLEKKNK